MIFWVHKWKSYFSCYATFTAAAMSSKLPDTGKAAYCFNGGTSRSGKRWEKHDQMYEENEDRERVKEGSDKPVTAGNCKATTIILLV